MCPVVDAGVYKFVAFASVVVNVASRIFVVAICSRTGFGCFNRGEIAFVVDVITATMFRKCLSEYYPGHFAHAHVAQDKNVLPHIPTTSESKQIRTFTHSGMSYEALASLTA